LSAGKARVVHGDDLLYRFFRDLFDRDPDRAQELARELLEATAIWLPLELYRDSPILLPWVVRDPACRGNRSKEIPDQWSSPDEAGYLRDDNSMIKSIPRSLAVKGPSGSHLLGARMGTEFVASHIWRVVDHEKLASRLPLLNSFVPNLVWLPSQIAKLSDQEGAPLQLTLQSMAYGLYRHAGVRSRLQPISEEAWALIPTPSGTVDSDAAKLNWFEATDRFRSVRASRLKTVTSAFEALVRGDIPSGKVVTTRYTLGIATLPQNVCGAMLNYLRRFET
jgi:hypothetical protein